MDLKPGEDGFWLISPLTKATPKKEYVGVAAPQTPKDWEEPAKFLDAIKLQVTKDPDLVFAPVPKPILPYKDLFSKNKVWDKVVEEREMGLTREWVRNLNGKGLKDDDLRLGRTRPKVTIQDKAIAEAIAEAKAEAKAKAEAEAESEA